jgi:hypothetical protein
MNTEDEEFNRIEREAKQRMEAVKDTIRYRDAFPKDYRLPKPWVGLEPSDMPDGGDPMFDHPYFIKGMVYANNVLMRKNK